MDDLKRDIDTTTRLSREYFESELNLAKVELIDESSQVLTSIVVRTLIFSFALLSIGFVCIALAFYLSSIYNSHSIGFGLVAAGLILLSVLLYVLRKYMLNPIIDNYFIRFLAKKVFRLK